MTDLSNSPKQLIETVPDIESRQPVWVALSNLFLDTEVDLLAESIAQALASSPYSIEQLETILVTEVYPVCKYNLWSVAGEWVGFDEHWLVAQICRKRGGLSRRWNTFFARRGIASSDDWKRIKERVGDIRLKPPEDHRRV